MPDLHGWIVQRIDRVESNLRGVDEEHGRNWTTQWNASSDTFTVYDGNSSAVAADILPAAARLIALHDPAAVLRRCAADRKILARHRLNPDITFEPACEGCRTYGDRALSWTDNLNECPELLDLAEAHGLTPEILATLDRPVPPSRPESRPPVDLKAWVASMTITPAPIVPPALRGPNWKGRSATPSGTRSTGRGSTGHPSAPMTNCGSTRTTTAPPY